MASSAGMLAALGGLKKKPSAASEEMESMDAEDEGVPEAGEVKSQAADDVFDALKADDRGAFADALDRYVSSCMSGE